MENKNIYPNPFGWDEIEQKACNTFYEQRDASYIEPMEIVYQGNGKMAFVDNYEAPTPSLALVDGYKSKSELSI